MKMTRRLSCFGDLLIMLAIFESMQKGVPFFYIKANEGVTFFHGNFLFAKAILESVTSAKKKTHSFMLHHIIRHNMKMTIYRLSFFGDLIIIWANYESM